MAADFYEIVKSTIDKLAVDIADGLGIGFVDMDDTVNIAGALESTDDMIVYQVVDMNEQPMDPIWALHLLIGGKTVSDSANYDLAAIIGAIRETVKKGDSIDVYDYSEVAAPTAKEGYIYFNDVGVDPQAFEGASGIRMLNVNAAVVRTQL